MAATNFSVPRGHHFASMGDSPRSASGSDLGCFQILPLQWVSEYVRYFFVCYLRVENLFSTALISSVHKHTGLQSRCSGGLSSQCRTPRLQSLVWGWTPHSVGRTSAVVIILRFVGCLPKVVCLDSVCVSLFLPVFLWFLLYVFSHGKFFC